jgi:hypothetical protein
MAMPSELTEVSSQEHRELIQPLNLKKDKTYKSN